MSKSNDSSNDSLRNSSHVFSMNSQFIEELYEQYLRDPYSVDKQWHPFFNDLESSESYNTLGSSGVSGIGASMSNDASVTSAAKLSMKVLLDSYRSRGHKIATIDPLGISKIPSDDEAELSLSKLGLSDSDSLREALAKIKNIYCGNIGYEFHHLDDEEQKNWLYDRVENFKFDAEFVEEDKKISIETLLKIESFEQFLQSRFPGSKRFSIEGGENGILAARRVIKTAADAGVGEIVFGMPHRGRLSMLTKILNKPYFAMLAEFQGSFAHPEDLDISGDVKYHLGISQQVELSCGKKIYLSLMANPSHLEAVNPVVIGKVRAKQDLAGDTERKKTMGVLLHGDAAFAGQGVVMESLLLSDVPGYTSGGVVHIVVNNQVGFTATPHEAHSSQYSTDIAKIIRAPIFHVNGNDAEAVLQASKIATEFRNKFGVDVVLDIVCYRLHGHNEIDEPRFTQPLTYKVVDTLETPGKIYCNHLVESKVIHEDYYQSFRESFKRELDFALDKSKDFKQEKADWCEGAWSGLSRYKTSQSKTKDTGVDEGNLKNIAQKITSIPENFAAHKLVARGYKSRITAVSEGKKIDWATAESLAIGSLLTEGIKVRLSGQDSQRGTFSHRHSVITDINTGEKYTPLNNIASDQAEFEVINSFLSEYGVLGFEYGYSTAAPHILVMWEAQFGDFANGAQIIMDQFISSAEEKWMRMSGIVLLLPHGYEGQGPEHSSARLERYLQLCAKDNMQVVNCTTPANYFHVLRRQIHRDFRKPLIIMTPKSLLRHHLAVSNLDNFASGTSFKPVIEDSLQEHDKIKKVVISSGKVYYDLFEEREKQAKKDVAIIRIEEYYPFPDKNLLKELKKYKKATKFVWCQEEPKNMGAWLFIRTRINELLSDDLKLKRSIEYIGRPAAASTAAGYTKMHTKEQNKLVHEALK